MMTLFLVQVMAHTCTRGLKEYPKEPCFTFTWARTVLISTAHIAGHQVAIQLLTGAELPM